MLHAQQSHPRTHAIAAAVVALFVASTLPLLATAKPKWVRVSVPGTNADTSMTIAWNDTTGGSSDVEYGLAGGALNTKAKGASFKGKGTIGTIHEATLQGLKADTKYAYRVGGAGAWSKTYDFRTAPADGCTPITFIAGGDHRSDDNAGPNPKWKTIIEDMKAHKPRFILESGDLVRSGKDEKQWIAHMEMAEALLPWFPMMPAIGNHDSDSAKGDNAYYNQIFALPVNDISKTEDYWSFTYGNVLVMALSTQTFGDDGFKNQAKWLDATLTKYKDKTWKFAFYHHPSYTSYADLKITDLNHPPNEKGQNKAFVPMFDKHGVDIVFAGHNHFYERFKPKKGGKTVAAGQGTVYITSGGTGAFTYDVIDIGILKIEPMKIICGKGVFGVGGGIADGSVKCSGKNHFVFVKIDGNKLEAKVLATTAQNFGTDPKNKFEIDSFTLTKPGKPNCTPVGPGPDAGSSEADAGGAPDAGGTVDAGSGPADAGSTPDAGNPAVDAWSPAEDAITPAVDAGAPAEDVGTPSADAGSSTDAGSGAADGGSAGAADAGVGAGSDAGQAGADTGIVNPGDGGGGTVPLADGIGSGPGGGSGGSASGQQATGSSSGCSSQPTGQGTAPLAMILALVGYAILRRRQASASAHTIT